MHTFSAAFAFSNNTFGMRCFGIMAPLTNVDPGNLKNFYSALTLARFRTTTPISGKDIAV